MLLQACAVQKRGDGRLGAARKAEKVAQASCRPVALFESDHSAACPNSPSVAKLLVGAHPPPPFRRPQVRPRDGSLFPSRSVLNLARTLRSVVLLCSMFQKNKRQVARRRMTGNHSVSLRKDCHFRRMSGTSSSRYAAPVFS